MSKEEITRMQSEAQEKEGLKNDLVEAGNDVDKIVEVAKANGYDFSKEELEATINDAKAKQGESELDDDDLENVAGGAVTVTVSCCTVCVSVV